MTKEHYMALADFQELWTNRIKPSIPALNGAATVETCEAIIEELT